MIQSTTPQTSPLGAQPSINITEDAPACRACQPPAPGDQDPHQPHLVCLVSQVARAHPLSRDHRAPACLGRASHRRQGPLPPLRRRLPRRQPHRHLTLPLRRRLLPFLLQSLV